MTIARRVAILGPAILWLLLLALMIQDWVADPYNPGLRSTAAYGHNQEGALFQGVLLSTLELAVLYVNLRPWSFRASWGRALIALLLFLLWTGVSGMAVMHSGGVFVLHVFWLLVVSFSLIAVALASGLQALLRGNDAAAALASSLEAMKRQSCRATLVLAGALALACAREAPDRANTIQVPLLLLVIAAPALSHVLRQRARTFRVLVLVAQLGIYLIYETGVSSSTNMRVDLLPILAAIFLNARLVFRGIDWTSL